MICMLMRFHPLVSIRIFGSEEDEEDEVDEVDEVDEEDLMRCLLLGGG